METTTRSASWRLALAFGAVAGVVVVVSSLMGGGPSVGVLGFAAWALLPWLLLLVAARVLREPWAVAGAGLVGLAVEAGVRASVFVYPRGSTAAIALVFSPVFIAAVAMPAGAVAGWIAARLVRGRHVALRGALALVAAVALGLIVLGLARPELFPTAVWNRRRALERIGPPRVVTGAGAFELVPVHDAPAWFSTADLDGEPGDEIVVLQRGAVRILDATTLESRGEVELGSDGRFWNWFSRLARVEGRLVVVQQGGGYQDTQVLDTEGGLIWSYHPDPDLPPTALRAADLDGDGATEFYASTSDAVVRLDASGREVWRRPARMATLVATMDRAGDERGWLVAAEYPAPIHVFDAAGDRVATLDSACDVAGVVDAREGRRVVCGDGTTVGPSGAGRLPVGVEDFTITAARSVRWRGEVPHVALAAAAPRGVERWRILLLDPRGHVVYDEIRDTAVSLLVARGEQGSDTLLLSGGGLDILRPR